VDKPTPSTLDKLLTLTGKAAIFIPVAGQFVQIAAVGLHELAAFLDTSGADLTELDKTHADYQRRIALAKDPTA
jgi:hypothetical protein